MRNRRKGFTLVELMVVILIVSILAAVAIPILRGRIDAAKWSEGKAMMGTIATAIRAYHAEKGPDGDPPASLFGDGQDDLGFLQADLNGTYFLYTDFTNPPTVDMGGASDPLTFTVTCNATSGGASTEGPSAPGQYTLDEEGAFIGT